MTSNGISRSGVGLAVDREGDADAAEQQLGLAAAIVEHVRRDLAEPGGQLRIGRADRRPRPFISSNASPPTCLLPVGLNTAARPGSNGRVASLAPIDKPE